MAILPFQFDSGKMSLIGAATGQTIVKGDMLKDNGSGYAVPVVAGDGVDVRWIAMESVTTTADGQQILAMSTDGVTFIADCDAAWSITDIGTNCDIAAAGQLDPDAASDNIFAIERGVGTAEVGTKVIGQFTRGVPNS